MLRVQPAVVRKYEAEMVAGPGDGFTAAIKMQLCKHHKSFIACEIGPVQARIELIMQLGSSLMDDQLLNPYDSGC